VLWTSSIQAGGGSEVKFDPNASEVTHSFVFDRTFGSGDGQEQVFLEVSEFVQSALDGFNVCLFSYGQTGSGKTVRFLSCTPAPSIILLLLLVLLLH
jgi:hypothetical protein